VLASVMHANSAALPSPSATADVLGPASTGLAAAASRARRVCEVDEVGEFGELGEAVEPVEEETRFATVISGSIERRETSPSSLTDIYAGALHGCLFESFRFF
jgi:hypothetical protein